jgi:hypothetical protein
MSLIFSAEKGLAFTSPFISSTLQTSARPPDSFISLALNFRRIDEKDFSEALN